jgi:predicted PurR-regulated permease PerM
VQITFGEVAGLIAAIALLLLVGALAVPLLKLGRTVDQATRAMTQVADGLGPTLANINTTIDGVNETLVGVNGQLVKVDVMTSNVQQVTTNAAAMTTLFASTVGGPLVRVAAVTYGVRRAVAGRRDAELQREATARIKSERKAARRTKRGRK